MMKSDPGVLIVLEGIDGSGKSTIARLAAEKLNASLYGFPTRDTEPGKLIRRVFNDPSLVTPEAMLYLFVADAIEAQKKVLVELAAGKIVIYDRHTVFSAYVYQVTPERDWMTVEQIVQPEQFVEPDAAFIVDVPAEVSEARIAARMHQTGEVRNQMYERQLEQKRQRYLKQVGMVGESGDTLSSKLDGVLPVEVNAEVVVAEALAIAKRKRTQKH